MIRISRRSSSPIYGVLFFLPDRMFLSFFVFFFIYFFCPPSPIRDWLTRLYDCGSCHARLLFFVSCSPRLPHPDRSRSSTEIFESISSFGGRDELVGLPFWHFEKFHSISTSKIDWRDRIGMTDFEPTC